MTYKHLKKWKKFMQSIEYRYTHDPMIKRFVDSLEHSIYELKFTPSEIRECAMLAAIHYEQRRTEQYIMPPSAYKNLTIEQ